MSTTIQKTVLRGPALSGLEFAGLYEANSKPTYDYFASKGAADYNLIRLAFNWNELQPDVYGPLNEDEKNRLLENVAWAKANGQKVILDFHNYGRRNVYANGGITENFTDDPLKNLVYPWADYIHDGSIVLRNYGTSYFGTFENPVSANGYEVQLKVKFNTRDDFWGGEGLIVRPMYIDDSNYYEVHLSLADNNWTLRKKVGGTLSNIATGAQTWGTTNEYSINIDINQTTNGKINISIDGTPVFAINSINSDPALVKGKIQFFAPGVHVRIRDLVLDIAGDVSIGGVSEFRLTDPELPVEALMDGVSKLSDVFIGEDAVIGYDMNEPYGMPVPTTPQNYSVAVAALNGVPVASTTRIMQAMVDALVAKGDNAYVVNEMDFFANTHRFIEQYGPNPDLWIIDPRGRVIYSGHYYFDSNHSGVYADSIVRSNEDIRIEVEPFFAWCQEKNVIGLIGEVGTPPESIWFPGLEYFYSLADTYNMWIAWWAGGDGYHGPKTSIQPDENNFTVDKPQMAIFEAHPGYTRTIVVDDPNPPQPVDPLPGSITLTTSPHHQILVKDKEGVVLGEISDWFNLKFSDQLNNYGQASFDIPVDSDDAVNLISLRRYEIDIVQNGIVVWSGEQANADVTLAANSPNLVTVTCYTYLEMLNARKTEEYVRYQQIDQMQIVKNLVDASQAKTDGDFGFTFATITSTKLRDREFKLDNIMESITNMTNVIDGMDVWIDKNKVIHGGNPRRGSNKSNQYGFEWGVNVGELKVSDNFASPANKGYAIGSSDGITPLIESFTDVTTRQTYKLREQSISSIDVSESDNLIGKAEDLVNSNKNQHRTLRVTQLPNTSPSLGNLNLGDSINIRLKKGRYDINSAFRILGYECVVGNVVGEATLTWIVSDFQGII